MDGRTYFTKTILMIMSKIWSDSEKSKMRSAYDNYMADACKICTRGISYSSVGDDIETFTEASTETICGLEMQGGQEVFAETGERVWDATIRLPINTPLSPLDRIHITKLKGEAADIMYEVLGPINIGVAGKTARLRKLEL